MNAKQIWQTTIERLRTEVNPQVFTTWFQGTSARSFEDGVFVICVSSTFAKAQLESRFLDLIRPILIDIIGTPVDIRVEVAKVQLDLDEAARRSAYQATSKRGQRIPKGQGPANRIIASHLGSTLRGKRLQAQSLLQNQNNNQDNPTRPTAQPGQPASQVNTYRLPQEDYSNARAYKDQKFQEPPLQEAPKAQNIQKIQKIQNTTAATAFQQRVQQLSPLQQTPSQHLSAPQLETVQEQPLRAESAVQPVQPLKTIRPQEFKPVQSANTHLPVEGLLNPRYTFDTFIVGKSNKLAHATSLAVAENPGRIYNPLFLYGGVGLGKTHLLHAIGHAGEEKNLNVLYTTSEKFTNEIINAIRFQKTEEFRSKYRQIDILMIDDIQFIAGKESTEEEFFHTFNALHNSNKQIVVTSDRPPKAISSLQDRLRSRFEWGLLADVRPPEYEHRLEILHSKCNSLRFTVPNKVVEYIARPECSSVRELEGALNRVIAYGTLHDAPLTIELAAQALEHIYDKKPPVTGSLLTTREVLDGVCRYYNVNPDLLRGKQKNREIVWPRQVAMYLMREETAASLLQIGSALGGRDHTTIMHGWEKVHAEIGNNDMVRQEIAAVLATLHSHNYP
ncbi:chromosomal replication initiator protein DnaA [Ktedonobacteria bacterium brp13]|nr:chromosomal replication initiator protein DnaA [Ktedonobacteria bacterium brp13]